MRTRLIYFFFCHLLIFSAIVNISLAQKPDKKEKKESSLPEKDRIKFTTLYFNASKEKILGNLEVAASLYSQCVRINPRSASAMYELASVYLDQGKTSDALFFAKKAVDEDGENRWFLLLLADCYRSNNLLDDATGVYARMVKNFPYEIDYYDRWANTLLQMGKIGDAIKVYDQLEKKTGIQEEIILQKQRLYIRLGKLDKAVDEINKLISRNPREVRYYELLSDVYRANSMFDKALEALNRIPSIDPSNGNVHLKLADLYRSAGQHEKAIAALKTAFTHPGVDFNHKIGQLLSLHLFTEFNPEYKTHLLELTRLLVNTHPGEPRALAIYGDYLYRERNLDSAKIYYLKAIAIDRNSFAVWNQLVLTLTDLKQYSELLDMTLQAIDLFPTQPVFYLFNGIACNQLKKNDEAVIVLIRGIKLVVDNPSLLELFYSNLGDAYYQMNRLAESDSAYDKTLQINPQNAYVLNNYSYYLSLRKDKLEKAELMSKKANELEPDNSAFQDTYGWVLYGMGRYEEAKIWLEKAMESGGSSNGVIMEHYGDVHFRLGEKEKAIEYWEKALKTGRYSPQLEQKIKEKKISE